MKFFCYIILCFALNPLLNAKEKQAGFLVLSKGKVSVERNKKIIIAKKGNKVFEKDILITEEKSRAKVMFVDGNVVHVSPKSKLEITTHVFEEANGKKKTSLQLFYGKIRAKVTQKYDPKGENTYRVTTSSAVAGVRGTDFIQGLNPVTGASSTLTNTGIVEVGKLMPDGSIEGQVVKAGQIGMALQGGELVVAKAPKSIVKKFMADTRTEEKKEETKRELASDTSGKEEKKSETETEAKETVEAPEEANKDAVADASEPSMETDTGTEADTNDDSMLSMEDTEGVNESETVDAETDAAMAFEDVMFETDTGPIIDYDSLSDQVNTASTGKVNISVVLKD